MLLCKAQVRWSLPYFVHLYYMKLVFNSCKLNRVLTMFFVYGLQVTTPISWFIVFFVLYANHWCSHCHASQTFLFIYFLSLVWTSTVFIWLDILLSVSFLILLFFFFLLSTLDLLIVYCPPFYSLLS